MNAIVHEKSDGELVYITNKSVLDEFCGITPEVSEKLNFSFEKMFENCVKEYVKPENIHYISSDGYIPTLLERDCHGGIHCLTAEVPL